MRSRRFNKSEWLDAFWSKVRMSPDCWHWTAATNGMGYGVIKPFAVGGSRLAHRLSWEIQRGKIPDGLCVLHRCDKPSCVNPDHLFLGTKRDNMQDAAQKGRLNAKKNQGEKNSKAKLSIADVAAIRALSKTLTQGRIAEMFPVKQPHISRIIRGESWVCA